MSGLFKNNGPVFIAFAGALSILAGSSWLFYEQSRALVQAKTQHAQAVAKINTAQEKLQTFKEYRKRYEQLVATSFVGNTRLEWIEEVEKMALRANIPKLRFSLQQSVPVDFNELGPVDDLEISSSAMNIVFDLKHEGQFYHFFRYLRERNIGRFSVNSCQIDASRNENHRALAIVSMSAECEIQWYSAALTKSEDV